MKGFTLAELLVVTFLFGIAVSLLSQSYVAYVRLSHRTANAAVIQQDMRFVTEYLSRNIRTVPVQYPSDGTQLEAVTSTLRLKAEGQPSWAVRKSTASDPACGDASGVSCLLVSADDGVSWAPITSKHVNVDSFQVFVRPNVSPFVMVGGAYPTDDQPFITLHIKLSYVTTNQKEAASLEAQTTISSRIYVR